MLFVAFFQCYQTTRDLTWAYDTDFDRDIAFVHNSLAGQFGKDPTYAGQWLWYNPLVFSIETGLVRLTGLPINIVVARAGLYLNLLGPLAFFFMTWRLFNLRVAAAALLSYLFLAAGNIEGSGAATYSPWLYPVTFTQFLFYLNILLCFKAYSSGRYSWFAVLGASVGVSFLGHAAPALILILILATMQARAFRVAWRRKDAAMAKRLFLQGIVASIPFILISLPLLYYIVGKYHMHIVNKEIVEWRPPDLYWENWRLMLKENISVSFLVAVVGFIWFYRNFRHRLPRTIVFHWLIVSALMYLYTSSSYGIRQKLHIQLPDTVPSYHYFFYLKALQSVFFAFGLLFLLEKVAAFARIAAISSPLHPGLIAVCLLVITVAYFPVYRNRVDFSERRKSSLEKSASKDKVAAYQYITDSISADKVILCPEDGSTFPVMASGRKMVCVSVLFSNPYIDFEKRYHDAGAMISYLKTGEPGTARPLFDEYQVNYVFLPNSDVRQIITASPLLGQVKLKNDGFTLFAVNR